MARILVTGGAGYIGSILVPMLLNRGCKVVVVDNFMYGQTSLLDCCHNPLFQVIRGDVRDRALMQRVIQTADFIIPLACIVGAPACDADPQKAKTTNLEAIQLILSLRSKRQGIIFPNTNSGYGIGQADIYCTEETPLNPISLYGQLKVRAEKEILELGNSISLRLATVFGVSPRMRLDLLVNDFVYRAVNDRFVVLFEAHFKRNYIHVRDVARVFMHCVANFERMRSQVYNVGINDANLSKLELCQEIKRQVPDFYFHEAEIGQDPDKRNYVVSSQKLKNTGFKPRHSLRDGIAELIKGYQVIRNNKYTNI